MSAIISLRPQQCSALTTESYSASSPIPGGLARSCTPQTLRANTQTFGATFTVGSTGTLICIWHEVTVALKEHNVYWTEADLTMTHTKVCVCVCVFHSDGVDYR